MGCVQKRFMRVRMRRESIGGVGCGDVGAVRGEVGRWS